MSAHADSRSVPSQSFRIKAEVWGGVTGHRTGYLKFAGKEFTTTDRAEAERIARDYTTERMSDPHRCANFRYTVEPV